ncbi:MAG TPA: hypothetical protein VJK52_00130, partial [Candidatus Nanoarchaeia archaeon]|nr:hypothetical protein [Candidatus Nanoarchaeia archaeon]
PRFRHRLSHWDYTFLLLFPIVGVMLSQWFHLPYLLSILLMYGAPGLYLALRYEKSWEITKGLIFTLVVATPCAIIVDMIGTRSGIWYVPKSLFPRIFGVIPVEDIIWLYAAVFTVLILYAVLYGSGKHELVDRRMWLFALPALLALSTFFFVLASADRNTLSFRSPYAYTLLGTVFFLIPTSSLLYRFPKMLMKSLPVMGYFLYITILFEFSATTLQQWVFTGEYLLPPLIAFGNAIPWEEFFFVGIVGPLATILGYEFFDN